MPYESVPVTDDRAQALLTEYFSYREATFPHARGYVTTLPSAGAFTPPTGEFVLAVGEDGVEYGCGAVRRLDDEVLGGRPRSIWEVKHLWVREAGRGAGAGRALLAELERRARDFGAETVVLDTNASLTAANALYASSGYASIPPYNDNGNATTWYRKDLTTR
ncbi:GNAT family N-acetyltransferase [Gryllotalpicola reticulitermitis]|uniref:GNAT family N-acetyltransferase n=1 Tax=Gryllotalpicola reticulitermitis TaxID=1184153 RepID=A0ABV8Q678_9MICO